MAETDLNCGYYRWLGDSDVPKVQGSSKPIDPDQLPQFPEPVEPLTEVTDSYSVPRIVTRLEKGQALTHLEMDFNLASLFHKLNTSSEGDPWTPEENSSEGSDVYGTDIYFERHKPSREEEMEGLFATFSYAPIIEGVDGVNRAKIQNPFQTIKIQHTTDEIRYKLSNEQIPGSFDIEEDLHVTGSVYAENVSVSSSVRVGGNSSFDGDVYIVGNLYVNGVMFGNLSRQEYHPTSASMDTYANPGPESEVSANTSERPKYYTQEQVDEKLRELRDELMSMIPHDS